MVYSTNLLKEIELMASQMTPAVEIGILLGIDENTFVDDINSPGSPARIAYLRGYATTARKLRQNNLELAEAGSTSADEACRNYISKMLYNVNL